MQCFGLLGVPVSEEQTLDAMCPYVEVVLKRNPGRCSLNNAHSAMTKL